MLQLLRRMGRRRVAMLLAVMGATIVCVGMVQLHLLMTTSSGGSAGDASNANNCLPCSSHLQMQQQQQLPVGATADSSDVAFEAAMCPKPVSTGPKPRPARSLAIILLPEAFADMATALAAVSSSEELATRASSSSSSSGSSLQSRPPGFSKAFESVDELRRHRKLAQVHSRNKQKELATSGMMRANSSADVIPVPPQSTSSDDLQLLPFTLLGFELGEQLPYPLYLPRPSKQQLNNRVKDKRDAFVQVLADGIRAEMRKSLGPLSIQFIGLVPHDSPIDAMELQDTFTAAYLEAEPAMAQSLAGDDKARARGQAAAAASAAARASGKSVSDSTKAGAEAARALGPVTAKDLDPLDRVPVTLRIVKMPATSKRLELQRNAREFQHWHSSNRGSAATASPEWRLLSQLPQVDVRDALEAALPVTTANYVTWVNSNQLLFFNFSSILTSTLVEYSEADVAYAFGVPQEDDAGGREGFEESTMTSISCFPFATCRTTDQVAFVMNTTCARAVIADQATGDMQSSWHGEVFVWQRVRELCRPLVHVPGTVMTQRTDQQRTDELLQSIQVDDPSIKPPEKQARLAQLAAKQAEFTRNVIAIAMRKALIPLNDDMYHVWGDMSAFLSPALGFTIDRAAAEMQIQLETGLRLWNSGVAASVTSSAPGTTADSGSSSSNNNNNNNNNAVDDVCWRFRDCYVGDQVIDDSPAGQTAAQKSATDARRFVSNLCGMALALCQADNKAPLLAKSTLSLVESSVLHSGSGLDWVPFDLAQTAVAMAVSVAAMTPGDAAAFGVPVAAGRQASSSTPADAVAAVLAAVSSIESALRSTELSRRNRLYAMSYVRPPTEILAPPRKRVLAVIPSDPLRAYEDKGRAALLENYYNPAGFFDEVYLLSPLETVERYQYGMHIIPTLPHDIPSRLIQYKVDIVRAYGGYWASDAAVYNSLPGVKVVVSIHDSNPRLLHSSIAQADYVMTVSRALDSILTQRGVNPDRIFPYSNSVDLAVFNPQPESGRAAFEAKYPGFKYRILHVGRKTAQKNGDTLLKAMQILGPDYMLIMIGSSTSDANFFASLQDLVAQEGLQKRVVMLDGVENSELVNFYSFTDVFCTPSRWEGFGVVFVEALAAGAVVVTSDMSPVNEIIKHEENGYLVRDYTNPQALASALEYAATNAAFRDKMKINGPRTVRRFAEPRQRLAEAAIYRMIYESDIPVRPPVQRPPGQFDIQLGFKNYLMGFSFLDLITLSSSVCVSSRLSLSSGDMMCDGVHAMPNAAKLPWHPRTAYDLALPVHAVPLEIFEHVDSLLRWPITTAVAEDIDLAFEPFVVPTIPYHVQQAFYCNKRLVAVDHTNGSTISQVFYLTSDRLRLSTFTMDARYFGAPLTYTRTEQATVMSECGMIQQLQYKSEPVRPTPIVLLYIVRDALPNNITDAMLMVRYIADMNKDNRVRGVVLDFSDSPHPDLPSAITKLGAGSSYVSKKKTNLTLQAIHSVLSAFDPKTIVVLCDFQLVLPGVGIPSNLRQLAMGDTVLALIPFRLRPNAPLQLMSDAGFFEELQADYPVFTIQRFTQAYGNLTKTQQTALLNTNCQSMIGRRLFQLFHEQAGQSIMRVHIPKVYRLPHPHPSDKQARTQGCDAYAGLSSSPFIADFMDNFKRPPPVVDVVDGFARNLPSERDGDGRRIVTRRP